jgi:hypothetical protein
MQLLRKLLMLILAAVPAYCSSITYQGTDPNAWAASTTGTGSITSLNFNNFYIGSTQYTSNCTGVCAYTTDAAGIMVPGPGGVNFAGETSGTSVLNYVDVENYNTVSGTSIIGGNSLGAPIKVTPPAGATAVGVELMSFPNIDNGYTICVSTDGTNCTTYAISKAPTETFFGVTSTAPIAWVDFKSSSGAYTMAFGNVEYVVAGSGQQPSDTPEPLTALLFGSGLMLLLTGRYARKHRHATAQA